MGGSLSARRSGEGARPRFPFVRWTIIGPFVLAMVLNYLARSVLGGFAHQTLAVIHHGLGTDRRRLALDLGAQTQPVPQSLVAQRQEHLRYRRLRILA